MFFFRFFDKFSTVSISIIESEHFEDLFFRIIDPICNIVDLIFIISKKLSPGHSSIDLILELFLKLSKWT